LVWWKGKPYAKAVDTNVADEEVAIIEESEKLVEGTWRRMFELDLREDEKDFSSKILEKEYAELKEEIGELEGLDDELIDSFDIGMDYGAPLKAFGSFVSMSTLPLDWKSEMTFVKETDDITAGIQGILRGAKTYEQNQFEALLREVEGEVTVASTRVAPPPAPVVVEEEKGEEEAVVEEEAAPAADVEV